MTLYTCTHERDRAHRRRAVNGSLEVDSLEYVPWLVVSWPTDSWTPLSDWSDLTALYLEKSNRLSHPAAHPFPSLLLWLAPSPGHHAYSPLRMLLPHRDAGGWHWTRTCEKPCACQIARLTSSSAGTKELSKELRKISRQRVLIIVSFSTGPSCTVRLLRPLN